MNKFALWALSALLFTIATTIPAQAANDTFRIRANVALNDPADATLFGLQAGEDVFLDYHFTDVTGAFFFTQSFDEIISSVRSRPTLFQVGNININLLPFDIQINALTDCLSLNCQSDRIDTTIISFDDNIGFSLSLDAGTRDGFIGLPDPDNIGIIPIASARVDPIANEHLRTAFLNFSLGAHPQGLDFNATLFTIDSSELQFELTNLETSIIAGVPEPSTWLMMVFGFAVTGLAFKRRNHTQHMNA